MAYIGTAVPLMLWFHATNIYIVSYESYNDQPDDYDYNDGHYLNDVYRYREGWQIKNVWVANITPFVFE